VRAQVNEQLAAAKEKRSGLMSEKKLLDDMETRQQGLSSTVREILSETGKDGEQGRDYIEGIVADVISADAEYAVAVEAALEGMTDALVVNSTRAFLADSELQERLKSRVGVICTDRLEPLVDIGDLSGLASVLVDSIDAAIELSAQLGGRYRFVTTDGRLFNGANVIHLGPVGAAEGLISRKSRIHQLQVELAALSEQISSIQRQLEENNQQNEHLEKLCKDLRTAIYEANTEKINTESALQVIEQDIRRLTEEQPIIAGEIEMLAEEISQSVRKEYESKQRLEELEAVNAERTAHIEQLEARIAEKEQLERSHRTELTELKVQVGQIAEQQKAIRQRITSLQSRLQHGRMDIESARTDFFGCNEQMIQTERQILASESGISGLFVEKEDAQRISLRMHEKVREMIRRKEETENLLKQKRAEQSDIEQQIHEVQLELSQLAVRDEDLTQRVLEELRIDIAEAYENFEQTDVDWDAIRREISDLRGRIERLGNVNVDAIKEQEQLEERFDFLTRQVEDLNTSKTQLEQLIARINRESTEKFRVTFDEVRNNFQVIFRKLFGGGKADIFLEDPDNILECGIEILAKPPGKETRALSLLSGGEKTMTAIALLFAIFKTKPSPFCVLDEVDAALDEANNERFNMIVREFQKSSQFVIITHSKRTMSIADVLFGVTMQVQGVSKKISVQFDGIDTETGAAVA